MKNICFAIGILVSLMMGTFHAMDVKETFVVVLADGQESAIGADDFHTLKHLCLFGEMLHVAEDCTVSLPALTRDAFEALIKNLSILREGEVATESLFEKLYQDDRHKELIALFKACDYLGIESIEKAIYAFLHMRLELQHLTTEKDQEIVLELLRLPQIGIHFSRPTEKRQQWPHKIDLTCACINAAAKGFKEMLLLFLDRGAPLNQKMLHYASSNGRIELVQLLLERDCPGIDQKSLIDYTPLMAAVSNGHAEVVQALLEKGARVELTTGTTETALMIGIERGRTECVRLLLMHDAPAQVNLARWHDGATALMMAVLSWNKDVVQLLLDCGAMVNVINKQGQTALAIAEGMRKQMTADDNDRGISAVIQKIEEIIALLKKPSIH